MEKIAVFINTEGITASIKEKRSVRVYTKNSNSRIIPNEIPCSIHFALGISAVRTEIANLLNKITDCRIFAATEISGQLYYLLESNEFTS